MGCCLCPLLLRPGRILWCVKRVLLRWLVFVCARAGPEAEPHQRGLQRSVRGWRSAPAWLPCRVPLFPWLCSRHVSRVCVACHLCLQSLAKMGVSTSDDEATGAAATAASTELSITPSGRTDRYLLRRARGGVTLTACLVW